MLSVGIDLIEIERIKKSLKNDRFVKRVYGAGEIEELSAKNHPAQSYAAAFSAKEAFAKAIRTGIVGFSLSEVELLHTESGAPYLAFSGRAAEIVEKSGLHFTVSVTHAEHYASAAVLAYGKEFL